MRKKKVRLAAGCLAVAAVAALAVGVISGWADGGQGAASPQAVQVPLATKPNVIFIVMDDIPALDGRMVKAMPTANKWFVQDGITFSDFHGASDLCCPDRVGFWTGQFTHNHGVWDNGSRLFKATMTLATQFHGDGYYTFLAGKVLNGWGACCAPAPYPGWDDFSGFSAPAGAGGAYYNYKLATDGVVQAYGNAPEDYSTDVIASKAVSYIQSAPAGKPIFAWIAPFGPHAPDTPAPRYSSVAACNSVGYWKPIDANMADQYVDGPAGVYGPTWTKPQYVQESQLLTKGGVFKKGVSLVKTCETDLADDDLVAGVINALQQDGRLDNTLLILSGDNGMTEGEVRFRGKERPYVTNFPFYMWAGKDLGISEPRTIDERVQNIDLAPTLAGMVGFQMGPYPNGQQTPDGWSLLPLLYGGATSLGRPYELEESGGKETSDATAQPAPPWAQVISTESSPLATQGCAPALAAAGGCRWTFTVYTGSDGTKEYELYDISNGPCWKWTFGQPGDPCKFYNEAGNPAYASIQSTLQSALDTLIAQQGH